MLLLGRLPRFCHDFNLCKPNFVTFIIFIASCIEAIHTRQAIRGDSLPAAAKFASSCTKCLITVTIKYVIYAN